MINLDAIQDFTLEENPKAELGWAEGVAMNIGIKSGTNDPHGTAFAFGRVGSLDARNPLRQRHRRSWDWSSSAG